MASDECHACAELSVEQQSLLSESVFMPGQHVFLLLLLLNDR